MTPAPPPASDPALLDASCRVALAALLHDLGKPFERARIVARPDNLAHEYCPVDQQGRPTRIHAAFTALALEQLAPWLPLQGAPFGLGDDTLFNAAARHHKPAADSFLQWVIATADRVASGFERTEFEAYNHAAEPADYRTARLWPLLERLRLEPRPEAGETLPAPRGRYPLAAASPESLFPAAEPDPSRADAEGEYGELWQEFAAAVRRLPRCADAGLPAWLDALDALLAGYWSAIPSATFGVEPDVALYDHAKTTAALAVALWRYHRDQGHDPRAAAATLAHWGGRDEPAFLLVQAETSGIQDFIFASGGETQRSAAKLLRGRSAYVSLAAECAALAALDRLSLPPVSQVLNAAGKFLIVAPHTPAAVAALEAWRGDLDRWSLEHTFGQLRLNACWRAATANDWVPARFAALLGRLAADLGKAKLRPFAFFSSAAPPAVFDILDRYRMEAPVCAVDGRAPAERKFQDVDVCRLDYDQMRLGQWLAAASGTGKVLGVAPDGTAAPGEGLTVPLFGYRLFLRNSGAADRRFSRQWDLACPASGQKLFTGLARRYLNAHAPHFTAEDAARPEKYGRLREDPEMRQIESGELETLGHLAYEDRAAPDSGSEEWRGVALLGALKGDVDRLGEIFQRGLARPSFAKWASLSRQMTQFFSVFLPALCAAQFPRAYTVFAGGDDFFLLGPWHSQLQLAARLRQEFARYCGGNPQLHFSAAVSLAKPGVPIRALAAAAGEGLEAAKAAGRDRLACFGQVLPWAAAPPLLGPMAERLARLQSGYRLSTQYLYSLLALCDARAKAGKKPQRAIWRSQFVYRTCRSITERTASERDAALADLDQAIANEGIEAYGAHYRVPLTIHLYRHRIRE